MLRSIGKQSREPWSQSGGRKGMLWLEELAEKESFEDWSERAKGRWMMRVVSPWN